MDQADEHPLLLFGFLHGFDIIYFLSFLLRAVGLFAGLIHLFDFFYDLRKQVLWVIYLWLLFPELIDVERYQVVEKVKELHRWSVRDQAEIFSEKSKEVYQSSVVSGAEVLAQHLEGILEIEADLLFWTEQESAQDKIIGVLDLRFLIWVLPHSELLKESRLMEDAPSPQG